MHPKNKGGLGIRLAKEANMDLLAKWGWDLDTGKKSLRLDILRAKYLREVPFLKKERKDGDSWIWKGILNTRTILAGNTYLSIGNGRSINFWEDPWVPYGNQLCPTPSGMPRHNFLRVSDFIENGKWNVYKLNQSFHAADVHNIIRIRIPRIEVEDKWKWRASKKEIFTTKSAYLVSINHRLDGVSTVATTTWRKLWKSCIHQRHKILWWKLLSDCIPTRSILNRRMDLPDLPCFLCDESVNESPHHVFFFMLFLTNYLEFNCF